MDKLASMRVFCSVSAEGGFAAASRRLGMSTAMVSKHVRRLEDDLGVRLLDRGTRHCVLTEAGEVYLARCRQLLQLLADSETELTSLSNEVCGTLRMGAPHSFGTIYLARVASTFQQLHPQLHIDLRLSPLTPDLVEGGFDLAIHAGEAELADSQLIARRLGSFHMVVCASPGYLKEHGSPLAPEQLADHNCLVFDSESAYDRWEFSGHGREVSVQVSGNLHCNQGNALRMAALADAGIVRLPSYMVVDDLRARRLLAVMPGYASAERAIHAIYPHRRHQPAKVAKFIEFLADRLQRDERLGIAPPQTRADTEPARGGR